MTDTPTDDRPWQFSLAGLLWAITFLCIWLGSGVAFWRFSDWRLDGKLPAPVWFQAAVSAIAATEATFLLLGVPLFRWADRQSMRKRRQPQ